MKEKMSTNDLQSFQEIKTNTSDQCSHSGPEF